MSGDVMLWIALGLGGAVGAVARVGLDRLLASRTPGRIPGGTLVANVLGSAVLGALLLASLDWDPAFRSIGASGFCGALSTYSSFAVATAGLWLRGYRRAALLNLIANLGLGWLAALGGMAAMLALTP